jgi:hypothetical protein
VPATADSFVYPLGVVIVTTVSEVLAVIWYRPCGVCKYDATVFVAEASIAAVANGVPDDAVAVRLDPVPVVVTVPTAKGVAVYICLVMVVTEFIAMLSTPAHIVKSYIPASNISLFRAAVIKAEKSTVLLTAVPVMTCSAVVTGMDAKVRRATSLLAPAAVITGVAL